MSWHFTDDVEEYASHVFPLLAADPVLQTLPLTAILNMRTRNEPPDVPDLFGWWTTPEGVVAGAVSHAPPHDLVLGVVPEEAVRPLVRALHDSGREMGGVTGPAAALFAAVDKQDFGRRAELDHSMRLHRLDVLVSPDPSAAGAARSASAADRDLLLDWFMAFTTEAGLPFSAQALDRRLSSGAMTIWENGERCPVAMAGVSSATVGVVRVGPVYTPVEHRGRGYGTAVTHCVTQAALLAGAQDVVLFTDVANPTSNAIYRRLGFRAVCDSLAFRFLA